jgi:hypothetical protein
MRGSAQFGCTDLPEATILFSARTRRSYLRSIIVVRVRHDVVGTPAGSLKKNLAFEQRLRWGQQRIGEVPLAGERLVDVFPRAQPGFNLRPASAQRPQGHA